MGTVTHDGLIQRDTGYTGTSATKQFRIVSFPPAPAVKSAA